MYWIDIFIYCEINKKKGDDVNVVNRYNIHLEFKIKFKHFSREGSDII